MKLTYRGIQYNVAPASISTVNSGLTATYRGSRYHLLTSNAVSIMPAKTMKYRGVTIGLPETSYFPIPGTVMA
ncbi:MAG: hypothetical protein Kow00121_46220 [Elainellaceae cyanobacterium]